MMIVSKPAGRKNVPELQCALPSATLMSLVLGSQLKHGTDVKPPANPAWPDGVRLLVVGVASTAFTMIRNWSPARKPSATTRYPGCVIVIVNDDAVGALMVFPVPPPDSGPLTIGPPPGPEIKLPTPPN